MQKKNTFIIADKMMYSEIKAKYGSDFDTIANELRALMNSLADK